MACTATGRIASTLGTSSIPAIVGSEGFGILPPETSDHLAGSPDDKLAENAKAIRLARNSARVPEMRQGATASAGPVCFCRARGHLAGMTDTRIERDTMGDIAVPADRLWGAQ